MLARLSVGYSKALVSVACSRALALLTACLVIPGLASAARDSSVATLDASANNTLVWSSNIASHGDTVYWNYAELVLGNVWLAGYEFSSYQYNGMALKFDLPSSVIGQTIYSATLRLEGKFSAESFDTQYFVAAAAESWSTYSITWNNAPPYYLGARDFITPPVSNPVDFDVTTIVSEWANGLIPNYGFLLYDEDDYEWPIPTKNRSTTFYSRTTVHPPELIIEYSPPPAPTLDFTADPTWISQGGSSTLRWTSTNATGCNLGVLLFGASGSFAVSPTVTTTYWMTCSGAGGQVTESATVTVPEPTQAALGLAAMAALICLRRRRRSP